MLRQWRLNQGGDPDFVLPINPLTGQDKDADDDLNSDADPSLSPADPDDEAASNLGMDSAPDQQAWPSNGTLSLLPRSPGGFDFDVALLPRNARSSDLDDGYAGSEPQLDPSLADCAPGTVDAALAGLGKSWAKFQHGDPIGHPGLAESFIPIWGSGREALADLQEGDYLGAGVNAGLAALDAVPGEAILDSSLKGGLKLKGSNAWRVTRDWMKEAGYFPRPGQVGHHVFIPQGGWGKAVPDVIKNQHWNIKVIKDATTHNRVHGLFGERRYSLPMRFWHGTPRWFKAVTGGLLGKSVMDAREAYGQGQ